MVTSQDNTTAIAAVAAVGTAIGIILYMPKVHASTSALTRATINLDVINKVRFCHIVFLFRVQRYG